MKKKKKKKHFLLSIGLLASDRPDSIERCLQSLQPIRDALSTELVILDTGCRKEVRDILEKYADLVTEFKWCNDFARARNENLRYCRGDWYLYLDDDEWFADSREIIRFFQSGEYKNYGSANYIQRNFQDPDGIFFSDSWVSRMVRLEPDTHFVSKIHEYFWPVRGATKNISAVVNHTGYVYADRESRQKHFRRNSSLLLEMVREEPLRLRWQIQLIMEYRAAEEWEEMYRKSLEFLHRMLGSQSEICDGKYSGELGTFYGGVVEGLIQEDRLEEALEYIDQGLKDNKTSELCHAFLLLEQGVANLRLNQTAEAEQSIQSFLKIRDRLGEMPKELERQKQALLVDETFDESSVIKAYSIRICCGLRENRLDCWEQYCGELKWDRSAIYVFEDLVPELLLHLGGIRLTPEILKAMQLGWNPDEAWKDNEQLGRNPGGAQRRENVFRQERGVLRRMKEAQRVQLAQNIVTYLEKYFRRDIIGEYPELLPNFGEDAWRLLNENAPAEDSGGISG